MMLDVDHEITYDVRDGKSVVSETFLGTRRISYLSDNLNDV